MADEAASNNADIIMFPEIFNYAYEIDLLKTIADENNETLSELKKSAVKNSVYFCTGSMPVKENGSVYNRSYLLDPEGEVLLSYDKCHLFDVDLPHLKVTESSAFTKGQELKTVKTPVGVFGILICYDIRFPETARRLALSGAEIILVPAAFNNVTGPAHWDIMFRTRAVENQLFIAAASPARNLRTKYKAYGHSMIIDPWGVKMAEAGTKEKIIYAVLDPDVLKEKRDILPLLKHRRPELY